MFNMWPTVSIPSSLLAPSFRPVSLRSETAQVLDVGLIHDPRRIFITVPMSLSHVMMLPMITKVMAAQTDTITMLDPFMTRVAVPFEQTFFVTGGSA